MNFSIGVIISTYNKPAWLEKTLWGYLNQTVRPDEIIIADDGSTDDTRRLIQSFVDRLPLRHVWHEDRGFRKSRILNKAVIASTADYLIFTDQDCIPRPDFVEVHCRNARPGRYVSGGYFRLSPQISEAITKDDVDQCRVFDYEWLRHNGLPFTLKCTKLIGGRRLSALFDAITTAHDTWNGCNSSGWRADIIAANGFDERMRYGGQDREFGIRLVNNGIRPVQRRHSAIVVHLYHDRPYKTKESIDFNRGMIAQSKRTGVVATPFGIKEHNQSEQ